jgi:hypothetical protein
MKNIVATLKNNKKPEKEIEKALRPRPNNPKAFYRPV